MRECDPLRGGLRRLRRWLLATALLMTFYAPGLLLVAFSGDASWLKRMGLSFQIIAFYALSVGFVSTTSLWGAMEGLTSANPFRFAQSNMNLMASLFALGATALSPERRRGSDPIKVVLGWLLMTGALPLLVAAALVHVFFVMPVSYLGYSVVGVVVYMVDSSASDYALEIRRRADVGPVGDDSEDELAPNVFLASTLVRENPDTFRSFVVGVPAVIASIAVEAAEIFSS